MQRVEKTRIVERQHCVIATGVRGCTIAAGLPLLTTARPQYSRDWKRLFGLVEHLLAVALPNGNQRDP